MRKMGNISTYSVNIYEKEDIYKDYFVTDVLYNIRILMDHISLLYHTSDLTFASINFN